MGIHAENGKKTGNAAGQEFKGMLGVMQICQKVKEMETIKAEVIEQKNLETKGQYISIKAYNGSKEELYKPSKPITKTSGKEVGE